MIDLPSQREKIMFETSQSKTLEVVEKMLSNLKVKIEGTSSSTPATRTISKNGKEIVSDENIDFDTIKGEGDTALDAETQLYSNNIS